MIRSIPFVLATLGWTAPVVGQTLDLSRLEHASPNVRHAGVFDLGTGKFIRPDAAVLSVAQTIYDNTCTWSGGAFYLGVLSCEDVYDEGRVPFGGVRGKHALTTAEIAYCTTQSTGSVDIDFELHDTEPGLAARGSCTFGFDGVPPAFTAGIFSFDSSALGFPLPGSTSAGSLGCWIIALSSGTTSPCLTASSRSTDQFVWRFRQNGPGTQSGPLISGEPSIPGGAGTFGIPPGVDPIFGTACGTGLDNQDLYWLNVDDAPVGGNPPAGCAAPATGTYCYWFGGYPANPFAGFWLRLEADGSCGLADSVTTFCPSTSNSIGCTPTLTALGVAAASRCGNGAFELTASNLVGGSKAVWLYGTSVGAPRAFRGGALCIGGDVKSFSAGASGGRAGTCSGVATADFQGLLCAGVDAALVPGARVGVQCWSRDPGRSAGAHLSEGLAFTIQP
ncbi:MAG: hypothetical protein L6Q99_00180 [Planctomycetes bacterium]|nr:hypothetical protein [Planctomycetota bacterium]